jgi:hypothetical protein
MNHKTIRVPEHVWARVEADAEEAGYDDVNDYLMDEVLPEPDADTVLTDDETHKRVRSDVHARIMALAGRRVSMADVLDHYTEKNETD